MDTASGDGMTSVRKEHVFDVSKLERYLEANVGDFKSPISNLKQFKSGQSNPTFLFSDGRGREYVLRKKPPGKLLQSAHMIDREYRVMEALGKAGVPVPRAFVFCNDDSVIGTSFYVMEFIRGRIFRDLSLPGVSPRDRAALYDELNRVLSQMHQVDPTKIGLADFGKPGNYYARQIATWTRQYNNSKTGDNPSMDKLVEWLPKNIPTEDSGRVSLVHGDYRLDNVIFHPTDPKILAVLDWELSTLGHPFADLAHNCMIYHLPPPQGFCGNDPEGVPTEAEYVRKYCERSKIPGISKWNFYLAFALFRMAGIAQGVYKRYLQGNASSPHAAQYGPAAQFIADLAWSLTSQDSQISQVSQISHQSSQTSQAPSHVSMTPKAQRIFQELQDFMNTEIFPNEQLWESQIRENSWKIPPLLFQLQEKARARNLWNLFLPMGTPYGDGLSNLDYAPLAELMGKSAGLAPHVTNCAAPDSGNMEVLIHFGSAEQKEKWLVPLLEGKIRSCFGMTEPDVASSDARNIECEIVQEGNEFVINGRKWWSTGAADPRCKIMILMGKTSDTADPYRQQSMVLVPMETPGLEIIRNLPTFGFMDEPFGHCEISLKNVRIPVSNLIHKIGSGFEIAQARLGPGRIHHCMRLIGVAERSLEAMCIRSNSRVAFGKMISQQGTVERDAALSRCEIDQARLLTLEVARLIDVYGNKKCRTEIAMIKAVVPKMAATVIDRAIQVHGGGGVSSDFMLARAYAMARSLRIADGPDEVHLMSIGKREMEKHGGQGLHHDFQTISSKHLIRILKQVDPTDALQIYGLYKQGSQGDTNVANAPTDQEGQMRWQAWQRLKGMKKEDAMRAFLDKVKPLLSKL